MSDGNLVNSFQQHDSSTSRPLSQTHDNSQTGGCDGTSSLQIPPYWTHRRYESYHSIQDNRPAAIILEDHTEEPTGRSGSLWAKGVLIESHVCVTGTIPSAGSFVVWHCKIDTLDVGQFNSLHFPWQLVLERCLLCIYAGRIYNDKKEARDPLILS